MYACMHVCVHGCVYICMHVCMHGCMYIYIYICIHICIYIMCMHVCVYIYIYICVCIYYVYVFPATRNVTKWGGTIKTLTMLSRNGLSEALEIPGFIIALPNEIPPF